MSRRGRTLLLAAAALLPVSGCAVPLFPSCGGWIQGDRYCIDRKAVAFLAPGRTTKDDVIRNLGFPTRVLRNGTVYGYDWQAASWAWGVPGSAGAVVEKDHVLLVEFDAGGRVVRYEERAGYLFPEGELSGGAPPAGGAGER